MKIKKITIENFRCFENYKVEFAKNTTIFIGKNGTGKTNLLAAIVSSLSFPFANLKLKDIQPIAASNPDLKIVKFDTKGRYDARYDQKREDYIYPIKLTCDANFDTRPLHWALIKENKRGRLKSAEYRNAYEEFQYYYDQNTIDKPLPVLAFFSDSFPHIEANISGITKSVLSSETGFARNYAYYKWDEKTNCIKLWKEKFINSYFSLHGMVKESYNMMAHLNELYQLKLQTQDSVQHSKLDNQIARLNKELADFKSEMEGEKGYLERLFIEDKLKKFSEPLRKDLAIKNEEFQIDNISVIGTAKTKLEIIIQFRNGRTIFFDHLPQGYKRLFSIVIDIAYRSFILNKNTDPTGIVIIDEIELHLHPTLQQEVLSRFKNTFPNIQFIVSTHSPLVISNLNADGKENKIIKLEFDSGKYYPENIENVYGLDYSTNLSEVMEVAPRSSTIEKYINAYLFLYGKGKRDDANDMYLKFVEYLGGKIPEFLQKEINEKKKAYEK